MTKRTYESLSHELQSVGYLSLNKTLQFLKENYPSKAVSYPTALRLLENGHLKAVRIGSSWRLDQREINRFIEHGNREQGQEDSMNAVISAKQLLGTPKKETDPKHQDEDGKPTKPSLEESFIESMRQRGHLNEN